MVLEEGRKDEGVWTQYNASINCLKIWKIESHEKERNFYSRAIIIQSVFFYCGIGIAIDDLLKIFSIIPYILND
jgi:hypothetical protein